MKEAQSVGKHQRHHKPLCGIRNQEEEEEAHKTPYPSQSIPNARAPNLTQPDLCHSLNLGKIFVRVSKEELWQGKLNKAPE